jgi:hypothetical protein
MQTPKSIAIALVLLIFSPLSGPAALPLDTQFRYTGFLTENGNPPNGNYDLQAALYDNDPGGNQVGLLQTALTVPVANGVFQLTLDFGTVFNGTKLWLELRVKSSSVQNWQNAITLSPRQLLTGTPYALFAPTAGSVTNSAVTDSMIQDTTITASKIASGESPWPPVRALTLLLRGTD